MLTNGLPIFAIATASRKRSTSMCAKKKTGRSAVTVKKTRSAEKQPVLLALIRAIEKSTFDFGKIGRASGFGTILLTIILLISGGSWVVEFLSL
jgi:hypothetical protein